jgi:hypothetical protein
MKTLQKGEDFKRVKDFSYEDLSKMNDLLKEGWKYCSKKEYKDFYKEQKSATEQKKEDKEEKKEKKHKK